jgi:hypothetical protein
VTMQTSGWGSGDVARDENPTCFGSGAFTSERLFPADAPPR